NCDNAVHIRILVAVEECELRDGRNLLCFMTRTHARGHNQHVVSRAGSPIFTAVAHERRTLGFGDVVRRRCVKTLRQIPDQWNIVRHVRVCDLLAAAYSARGSDWLAKLSYKVALRDVPCGKAMTGWDRVANIHDRAIWQEHFEIGRRGLLDHGDIVVFVDNDRILADRNCTHLRCASFRACRTISTNCFARSVISDACPSRIALTSTKSAPTPTAAAP